MLIHTCLRMYMRESVPDIPLALCSMLVFCLPQGQRTRAKCVCVWVPIPLVLLLTVCNPMHEIVSKVSLPSHWRGRRCAKEHL